jgi:hypothetical protein
MKKGSNMAGTEPFMIAFAVVLALAAAAKDWPLALVSFIAMLFAISVTVTLRRHLKALQWFASHVIMTSHPNPSDLPDELASILNAKTDQDSLGKS